MTKKLHMPLYNCFVKLEQDELFYCRENLKGNEDGNWGKLTVPSSPVFLEIVNSFYRTDFGMDSFNEIEAVEKNIH